MDSLPTLAPIESDGPAEAAETVQTVPPSGLISDLRWPHRLPRLHDLLRLAVAELLSPAARISPASASPGARVPSDVSDGYVLSRPDEISSVSSQGGMLSPFSSVASSMGSASKRNSPETDNVFSRFGIGF